MLFKKNFGDDGSFDESIALDPTIMAPEAIAMEKALLKKVVGQDLAVKKLVRIYQTFKCGLNTPGKPLGVLLFLGPTGSGKTRLVEALAEVTLGARNRMIKLDCAEFQKDHEIAKIIGSPPGYVGHDRTTPRITQMILDKWNRPDCKISILLFDEIEKASEDLFQLMLGMMEGRLTLGNNDAVDLTKTIIIMTSNIAADEMQRILSGSVNMGFTSATIKAEDIDDELWKTAKDALKDKFSPEFINRISQSIVFRTLSPESLIKIIDIELDNIQDRLLNNGNFIQLDVTLAAKQYICKEGIDPVFGARELNRMIERLLIEPMADILASKQIASSDILIADYLEGDKLNFYKLEDVLIPPSPVDTD